MDLITVNSITVDSDAMDTIIVDSITMDSIRMIRRENWQSSFVPSEYERDWSNARLCIVAYRHEGAFDTDVLGKM